jgi:outer membrane protein OmpU
MPKIALQFICVIANYPFVKLQIDFLDLGPPLKKHEGNNMKKILLATTILGLSAGYAAADISWSASAGAGMASDVGSDFLSYSFMKVGVKGSAETDGGITFSGSMDMTRGTKFNTGDDLGDGFESKSGSFGMPTIAIGGAFGTISFSDDNFDFFDDSHDGGDVKYVGTFGAITAGLVSDVDSGDYSIQLGYSADAIAVSVDTDSHDVYNASVAYTMGAIKGTLSTDASEVIKLKLAYSADAISASVKVGDDDSYALTAGYTANGMTIGVETDSDDYTKVTGSYDLGGGLSIVAGADSDESAYVGAAMKF